MRRFWQLITQSWRLLQIFKVLIKHLLHPQVVARRSILGFLSILNPYAWGMTKQRGRGERIRDALVELGPIFVKFGQMLSTRADILPEDIVQALTQLQDRVPPFPAEQALAMVEKNFKKPVEQVFAEFDATPLASASIAQVHAAILLTGEDVIVKILRPKIQKKIKRDVNLLYTVASVVNFCWSQSYRLRPLEVVQEFDQTLQDELDLMREAANAQQLQRNFQGSVLLHVPVIYWDYTSKNIMVQERVYGTSIGNMSALRDAGVNFRCLAERGVEIFFTQVFRDAFFHADMHPGNLFVDITNPQLPSYIGVDFGIVGTLNPTDQRYLAENMLAFFRRDYRRVAVLHVESGWVPADTRIDQMESAIRTVSEPLFERPLADISFGQVLLRLFQVAERFHMTVQPQLLLLQKTLFNIEALGRQLYPELDLWATAQPHLQRFVREQKGLPAILKNVVSDFPDQVERALQMPNMLYRLLEHAQLSAPATALSHTQKLQAQQARAQKSSFLLFLSGLCLFGAGMLSVHWFVHLHWLFIGFGLFVLLWLGLRRKAL